MILKIKQFEKDTFGNFWRIKVQYVPGLRNSTQCRFSAKPTVAVCTTLFDRADKNISCTTV